MKNTLLNIPEFHQEELECLHGAVIKYSETVNRSFEETLYNAISLQYYIDDEVRRSALEEGLAIPGVP